MDPVPSSAALIPKASKSWKGKVVRIFQYGSNTLDSQLNGPERLNGGAKFIGAAALFGWKLEFNVESRGRGCAAASVTPSEGAETWGALYEIDDALVYRDSAKRLGRKSLDQIEGEGTNYRREKVTVRLPDNTTEEAVTYIALKPVSGIRTNLAYVAYVIRGLRERGVAEDYIEKVKAIAIENVGGAAPDIQAL